MKRMLVRFFGILALLSLVGAGCTNALSPETQKASQRVTLNVWGVVDDVDVYQNAFSQYRAQHPNVVINFRRLRLEEYENLLLNGFAEDRGPDIFLVHNDWIGKYMSKIVPMPTATKVAYSVTSGTIKKDTTWELRTEPTITMRDFKDQYADAVLGDAIRTVVVPAVGSTNPSAGVRQERVMAAPIWVDTLALYYNKDLLNAAGIPTPPEYWDQFQDQVKKITKLDNNGNILQSAVGMGTSKNVERSTDLLTVLMMQNGAQMAGANGLPTFNLVPESASQQRQLPPGYQALEFYTDFANPTKETYTWNDKQPNSLDAFIQGKTAFFFGYAYQYDQIKARAPKLNLGITKLPQIDGNPAKNMANYWMWVVSKKSLNQDTAWNLLNYLMQAETSKALLANMKRPAARKRLLADQFTDEQVGVFASQVLTAQSWYTGNNAQVMEDALSTLIDNALVDSTHIDEAMQFTVSKIRQTFGDIEQ